MGNIRKINGLRPTLNARQLLFVQFYAISHDLKGAIIKAGYSEKNWDSQSSKLMRHPVVLNEIKLLESKINNKASVTVDWIINKLKEHAECDDKDVSIKAIAELNKMAGNYAPTKNINLNLDMTLETVEQLGIVYKSS